MRTKIVKTGYGSNGMPIYQYTRKIVLYKTKGNNTDYFFKNTQGYEIEPTEAELEMFNDEQTGGMKVQNGWLTFLGILALVNLIGLIILISKIASIGSYSRF